jgi:sugar lactone lactonase YvrE
MKTNTCIRATVVLLVFAGLAMMGSGCKKDPPASLFDPTWTGGPKPVITGVTPPTVALAGVSVITIAGQNFSSVKENNLVFFNTTTATVIDATPTQIRVKAPNLVKDTVLISIAVRGSQLFNDPPFQYRLDAAVLEYGALTATEEPYAMATDGAGNLYVSMLAGGSGVGVRRFRPDSAGVAGTPFSPAFNALISKWSGMKVGPGGVIYTVATRTAIFSIPAAGGASTIWLSGGGLGTLVDLDFDANNNIWAGGIGPGGVAGTSLYRVTPAKSVKAFPFVGSVRSVRVFNNYLYVSAKRDSLEKIFRLRLVSSDSLGTEEEYFNVSSVYGANGPTADAITFASDGDMYVGTSSNDGVLIVHPDKTSEPLYPPLVLPETISMAYGSGPYLYLSRNFGTATKKIIRVNLQKNGAPYYGRP